MGYYMGDYYGSGASYYRGDPGFFSFLGGLAKKAVGLIPGVGPAISEAISVASPAGAGMAARVGSKARIVGRAVGSAVGKHPVLSAAGGAAIIGAMGAGVEHAIVGAGGACPKGYHISKSKHAKHYGACVRNRRMRVTNPKALRRAIRRAHGFARMARKCISFTSARPPKGRMYFKHRKRK